MARKAKVKEKYISRRELAKGVVFELKIRFKDEYGQDKVYSKSYSTKICGDEKSALKACKMDRDMFLVQLANNETIIKKHDDTVLECFEKSLELSSLSFETMRKKRCTLNKWIKESVLIKPMQKVNANTIQKTLVESVKNGASKGIVDDLMTIWKGIINYARRENIIKEDLMIKVDAPIVRKATTQRDVTTNEVVLDKVIEGLRKHTMKADKHIFNTEIIIYALKVMWYTGLRPSECFALERKHVDIANGILHIQQSIGSSSRNQSEIRNTKTINGIRDIPLIDDCINVFIELMNYQDSNYLFADFEGKLINSTIASNKINNACRKEGIEFNMYRLRHNLATTLIQKNTDPRTVQEIMGHENADMSLYYARSNNVSKVNALKNLKINAEMVQNVGENVGDYLKS